MDAHQSSFGIKVEKHHPLKLSEQERAALGQALFADVQTQIFHGVSYPSFYDDVVSPEADYNVIYTYTDQGKVIGYLGYWYVLCELQGKPSVLVRSAGGVMPDYQSKNLIGPASARFLLGLYAQFPLRSIYVFTSPINPLMYAAIDRTLSEYWPNPYAETPHHAQQLTEEICRFFSYTSCEDNPMVREVGWKVNNIQQTTMRQSDPAIQFFCQHNPRYAEGYGLIVVSPLHWKNMLTGIKRLFHKHWKRLFRARKTQAFS